MSLIRVQVHFSKLFRQNSRLFATSVVPASDEYVAEAEYPPIIDPSFRAKQLRRKVEWHEKLRAVSTVEEKLIGINMPRYYGYKCVMLSDEKYPYNCLNFKQFITRTVFHECDKLPEFYGKFDEIVEKMLPGVRSAIEETLLHELQGYRRSQEAENVEVSQTEELDLVTLAVVRELNRVIVNSLEEGFPHLEQVDVDFMPQHEAFWTVGGMNPPLNIKGMRGSGYETIKPYKDDPVDRFFQYRGSPYLTLRHKFPLEPLREMLVSSNPKDLAVPAFHLEPNTIGYNTDHCHATCIPGFWPGESREFGTISFQRRSHLLERNPHFGAEDDQEALHAQGIVSSYSWLLAQAANQGFNTYNELTYPLVTQTVITDGQKWSFYAYQLNTLLMHSHFYKDNPRGNECWGTTEEKLFEEIDADGKFVGFNDEVLKKLLKFYCNTPQKRNIEMKPYLNPQERIVAEIENPEKRMWLEKHFKHYMSNKPRHRVVPEIFLWEKIYQIDHNKRPIDARRKFFQLNKNPFNRRLNEHAPVYIPRCVRPGGHRSKVKFHKTYYPDC
ncbi:Ribosomal protein S30, mitochondrial [Sergentomyia squamirostris]